MATLYGTIGGTTTITKSKSNWDAIKDFLGRVAAHVPSEVIAIYMMGKSMGGSWPDSEPIWTLICWGLSIFLRWMGTDGEGKEMNVVLSALAFPIWAIAMGGTILGWVPPEPIPGWSILIFSVIAGALYNDK
jgi:hypothetical protein